MTRMRHDHTLGDGQWQLGRPAHRLPPAFSAPMPPPTPPVSGLPDLLSRLQDGRVSPGLGRPAPPRPWQPGFSWDQAGATAREVALESVDGELPDTGEWGGGRGCECVSDGTL